MDAQSLRSVSAREQRLISRGCDVMSREHHMQSRGCDVMSRGHCNVVSRGHSVPSSRGFAHRVASARSIPEDVAPDENCMYDHQAQGPICVPQSATHTGDVTPHGGTPREQHGVRYGDLIKPGVSNEHPIQPPPLSAANSMRADTTTGSWPRKGGHAAMSTTTASSFKGGPQKLDNSSQTVASVDNIAKCFLIGDEDASLSKDVRQELLTFALALLSGGSHHIPPQLNALANDIKAGRTGGSRGNTQVNSSAPGASDEPNLMISGSGRQLVGKKLDKKAAVNQELLKNALLPKRAWRAATGRKTGISRDSLNKLEKELSELGSVAASLADNSMMDRSADSSAFSDESNLSERSSSSSSSSGKQSGRHQLTRQPESEPTLTGSNTELPDASDMEGEEAIRDYRDAMAARYFKPKQGGCMSGGGFRISVAPAQPPLSKQTKNATGTFKQMKLQPLQEAQRPQTADSAEASQGALTGHEPMSYVRGRMPPGRTLASAGGSSGSSSIRVKRQGRDPRQTAAKLCALAKTGQHGQRGQRATPRNVHPEHSDNASGGESGNEFSGGKYASDKERTTVSHGKQLPPLFGGPFQTPKAGSQAADRQLGEHEVDIGNIAPQNLALLGLQALPHSARLSLPPVGDKSPSASPPKPNSARGPGRSKGKSRVPSSLRHPYEAGVPSNVHPLAFQSLQVNGKPTDRPTRSPTNSNGNGSRRGSNSVNRDGAGRAGAESMHVAGRSGTDRSRSVERRQPSEEPPGTLTSRVRQRLESIYGSIQAAWKSLAGAVGKDRIPLGMVQQGLIDAGVDIEDAVQFAAFVSASMQKRMQITSFNDTLSVLDWAMLFTNGGLESTHERSATLVDHRKSRTDSNINLERLPKGISNRSANTILFSMRPTVR